MEKSEVMAIAAQIAANCTTCSEVAEKFNSLVAKYGKEDAKLIQAQAKEDVKRTKLSTKSMAAATIDYLGSSDSVRAAFRLFIDNDANGEFAKLVVSLQCNNDIDIFVTKYCSYYTEIDGVTVVLNRIPAKDADGNRIAGQFVYRPKKVEKAIGYNSVLKECTKNAKRIALGASFSEVTHFVPCESVEFPAK